MAASADYVWGDAEVTHPDWKGTAQLDQKITGQTSLYDLVGLDHDEWMIIGLDLGGGEHKHNLHVIAVPAGTNIHDQDEIQATDFLIHDVDPYRLLKAMSHVFELRMRLRALVNVPIRIVELSDVPEQ
jgi:hypothetical protein